MKPRLTAPVAALMKPRLTAPVAAPMKPRLTAPVAAAAMAIPVATAGAAAAQAAPARVLLTLQVTDRAGHRVVPADAQVMAVATGTNIDLGSGTRRLLVPGR
jgi:hypothetical protein